MADLKTDYKDDVLDTSVNSKRTFNIVDQDGNIIYENVTLDDTTTYSQIGDSFGALDINSTNEAIEQVSSDLETHTHDGRYYTETEIDTKFKQVNSDLGKKLPLSGGKMSGGIEMNGNVIGSVGDIFLNNKGAFLNALLTNMNIDLDNVYDALTKSIATKETAIYKEMEREHGSVFNKFDSLKAEIDSSLLALHDRISALEAK